MILQMDVMPRLALACSFAFGLVLALVRPRQLVLLLIAGLPLQWMFVQVGTFYLTPLDPLVAAGLLGFAVRLSRGSADAWLTARANALAIAFVLSFSISFVATGEIPRTWFRMVLSIAPVLLAADALRTDGDLRSALFCLAWGGCIDIAYGLFGLPSNTNPEPGRFEGMSNPNFTALLLLAASAALLFLVGRSKGVFLLLLVLAGFGIGTQSRAAILAFLVVLVFVVWPASERRVRWLSFGIGSVAGGSLFLVVPPSRAILPSRPIPAAQGDAAPVLPTPAERAKAGASRPTAASKIPTSIVIRTHVLRMAWKAFRERPLTGIGIGRFRLYSNEDPLLRADTGGKGTTTHNSFLEVLVEGGVVPFLLLLVFLVTVLVPALRLLLRMPAGSGSSLGGALAATGVWVIGALFANVLLLYPFWITLGLVRCAMRAMSVEPAPASAPTKS